MPQLVFANPATAGSEGSSESGGWKPVLQDGDEAPAAGRGVQDKSQQGKTEDILLKPKMPPKKKRRPTPKAGSELGIGRRDRRVQDFGGDPKTYNQPYTKFQDQSAGEYKYAPGDPGSAGGAPMVASTARKPTYDEVWEKIQDPEKRKAYSDASGEFQTARSMRRHWERLIKLIDSSPYHKELKHFPDLGWSPEARERTKAAMAEWVTEQRTKEDAAKVKVDEFVKEFGLGQRSDEQKAKIAELEVKAEEYVLRAISDQDLSPAQVAMDLRQAGVGMNWFDALGYSDHYGLHRSQTTAATKTLLERLRREGKVERALGLGSRGRETPTYRRISASLVFAEDTLYQDVTSPFPAPQGGSNLIPDTNEVPRNRPRIAPITDRAKRLDRMKHWSGLPEPTPTPTVQNDNMTYPLGSLRLRHSIVAADGDTPEWGFFGYPEFKRSFRETWGGKELLVNMFKVAIYDQEGDSQPSLWLTFYILNKDGKLSLHESSYLFDYANQKKGEAMFGASELPSDTADDIFGMMPDEVLQAAMDMVRPKTDKPDKAAPGKKETSQEPADQGTAQVKQAREETRQAQAEAERARADAERAKGEKAKALADERLKQAEVIRKRSEERERSWTEKIGKQRSRYYNVLTDPVLDALDPEITPVERLFTTITKWEDGGFTADANRLDSKARELLESQPKGDGTYFSWDYSSAKKIEEEQVAKSKAGKMTVDRPAVLRIQSKDAWTKVQDEVFKQRKEFLGREQ